MSASVKGLFQGRRLAAGIRSFSARKVGLVCIAACLILVSVATPAFAAPAAVSINPTHGLPGAAVVMKGSGFAADAVINVAFGSGNGYGTSAASDAAGTFTDYMAVPPLAPGVYVLSATDGKNKASANFTIDGSTSTTTSSTTSSTTSAKTATVTATVTSSVTTTSITTVTTTSTTTSFSTSTTTLPAVTVTSTKNYTTTESPAAPITSTATVTRLATAVTLTVSTSKSGADTPAAQGSPRSYGGLSDTLLYFLAGVGIMVTAISIGMLAFREKTIEDYGREAPGRSSST
jgi:hypothetical protein